MARGTEAKGVELRIDNVRKDFGGTHAVDGISLRADGGTFLTLLGASGSGKSTTLMLIAGFLKPDAGVIAIDGDDVVGQAPHERDFGVVFQNYALFPHLRVDENVGFPLKMRNRPRAEIGARVEETLDLVKLGGLGDRMPHQLSGGQQQRVALARAVVARPRLLLMDEPLSALDKQLREHMQLELKNIQRKLGVTVVYVTHDQSEALIMSDRIAVMRAGRIEQFGSPREIYDRPATRYTAEFVGDSNLLEGVVQSIEGQVCRVACGPTTIIANHGGRVRVNESVQLIVRPEALRLGANDALPNQVSGVIEDTVYTGDALNLRLRAPSGSLFAFRADRRGAAEALKPGDPAALSWGADDTVLVQTRA